MSRCLLIASFCLFASRAFAQEDVAALKAEIEKLKQEIAALKAENAALKEKLGDNPADKVENPKPSNNDKPADIPGVALELSGDATLGAYKYKTPNGWTSQPMTNNKLGTLYRSPDKSGVILVQVKVKGGAPPEMAPKYAESVITMLKADFTKSKTELVSPPKSVNDTRFFAKVQEQFKVKDKTAEQTHLYRVSGNNDMLEMTVISTGSSDVAANTLRLAEEMLLSFTGK
jgi:hypothetical protein